jgi:hypothetical protein
LHVDLREQLGRCNTYVALQSFLSELAKREGEVATGEYTGEDVVDERGLKVLPHWVLQPHIRPLVAAVPHGEEVKAATDNARTTVKGEESAKATSKSAERKRKLSENRTFVPDAPIECIKPKKVKKEKPEKKPRAKVFICNQCPNVGSEKCSNG